MDTAAPSALARLPTPSGAVRTWRNLQTTLLWVAFASTAAPAAAQPPPSPDGATPRDSPSTLSQSALQQRVDAFEISSGIPAVGAAVVVAEQPTVIAVSGRRTSRGKANVTPEDLWHLGSITKSFTATLVARLIERSTPLDAAGAERLAWETPIGRLLPAARGTPFENVSLRLFLSHRAGLVANPPMSRFATRDTTTPIRQQRAEIATELLATAPESTPGTTMLYSNAGYIVVGAALERLLDASWEELVRREVFAPLGLESAGFGPPGSVDEIDQPWGHAGDDNTKLRPVAPSPIADNPAFLGPAGTVHMSLDDLATYLRAHLEGELGKDGFVSAQAFHTLHTPVEGQNYALGWIQFPDGEGPAATLPGAVYMHNGSNTLWYAVVFFAPAKRAAVAITTNAGIHNAHLVNVFALELLRDVGESIRSEEH